MSLADQAWHQAQTALQLLAQDERLGGLIIRARAGPVRDRFMEDVATLCGPLVRLHPTMSDEVLFGGMDVSATLAKGTVVDRKGLLAGPGTRVLSMGERCPPGLAARLAAWCDATDGNRLIILDEGVEADESAPKGLVERLAFYVDLNDIGINDLFMTPFPKTDGTPVILPTDALRQLTLVAADLGIDSLRAPQFAARAAKAHAALMQRQTAEPEDLTAACALVLSHRATRVPEPAAEEPNQPPQDETQDADSPQDTATLPDELLLDAVRAMLPDDLLSRIAAQRARQGKGNGSGAARKGNRRGRPLPSRPGRMTDGARIDLIATLRAAAPWQTIRRQASGRDGLQIRQTDIHLKRFEERSDRVLIFAVDASGSAAVARLAEAKGAVELLLSQAYARRDHVSLIAFRGQTAELLLPPTRSLVQTKRRLAALPGGGGTPLAAGLQEAMTQGLQAKQRGLTPTIIILTDGRANIALDGSADRKIAASDAARMAAAVRAQGFDALVIDTGNRPEKALRTLSQALDAPYLPMPRADAKRLSGAVATALGD